MYSRWLDSRYSTNLPISLGALNCNYIPAMETRIFALSDMCNLFFVFVWFFFAMAILPVSSWLIYMSYLPICFRVASTALGQVYWYSTIFYLTLRVDKMVGKLHFGIEWKWMHFYSNFTAISFYEFNWQYVITDSYDGLESIWGEAITLVYDGHRRIYALRGLSELTCGDLKWHLFTCFFFIEYTW